jgi:hypothetical protein
VRARVAAAVLLAALAAVCGSDPARAALIYDFSLGGGVELNDNIFLVPRPTVEGQAAPVKSTVLAYSPGVKLSWEDRQDWLRLDYQGVHQDFHGEGSPPAVWLHDLSAELQWRNRRPFFLEVREDYARVPQYRSSAEVDLYAGSDRNTVTVRPGLSWDLGRTGVLDLALRGESQAFPHNPTAESERSVYGEVSHLRRWTPLWSTSLRLDYGEVRRTLEPDYREAGATLEVDQRWSPGVSAVYSLEWRQDRYASGESSATPGGQGGGRSDSYLLKGVTINGQLEYGGSWHLLYQDRIEDLLTGERLKAGRGTAEFELRSRLGSRMGLVALYENRRFATSGRKEVVWGPTASARWVMTSWLALDLDGFWTRIQSEEPGLPEVVDRQLSLAAGFIFVLARHVQCEVGYRYLADDSTDPNNTFRNNRVAALLTWFFQPLRPGVIPESITDRFSPYPVVRERNALPPSMVQ